MLFLVTRGQTPSVPAAIRSAGLKASGETSLAVPTASDTQAYIRFYQARAERDPEDTRAQNSLAELCLEASA